MLPTVQRTLNPPTDPNLRRRLIQKQLEYRERIEGKGRPWESKNPGWAYRAHEDYRSVIYKFLILSAALEAKTATDTWTSFQENLKKNPHLYPPEAYDLERVNNAWG